MQQKLEIHSPNTDRSTSEAVFHAVSPRLQENPAHSTASTSSHSSSPTLFPDRTASLSPEFGMVDDQGLAIRLVERKEPTINAFHHPFVFEHCSRVLEDQKKDLTKEIIIETYFSQFIAYVSQSLTEGRITYIAMDYEIKTHENKLETCEGDSITGGDLTAFLRIKFHDYDKLLIIIPNSSDENNLKELIRAGANIISAKGTTGIHYIVEQIQKGNKFAGLNMARAFHEADVLKNETLRLVVGIEREEIIDSFGETSGCSTKPSM